MRTCLPGQACWALRCKLELNQDSKGFPWRKPFRILKANGMFPRTKIVATLGPASESEDSILALMRAGVSVFRLNFSHASAEWARLVVDRVRQIAARERTVVALFQDLQGPRLRIGNIKAGSAALTAGQELVLTQRAVPGDATAVQVEYPPLARDVRPGQRVLLDDGQIELEVTQVAGSDVRCRVRTGGELKPRKGINLPDATISAPTLTQKDRADALIGVALGVDYVALSFVRSPADLETLRAHLIQAGAQIPLIAKIERREAVADFDAILQAADGIMVARGDLGIEMGPEQVPLIQKQIIQRCRAAGKPVITATQMLESMISHPRPTRAEASDVANAILDGTDAVMLSAETAAGSYPTESVQTMVRIGLVTERALPTVQVVARQAANVYEAITDAVSSATVTAAADLHARLLVTVTDSGHTARMVAKHRPLTTLLAVTPDPATLRRLALVWGVRPYLFSGGDRTTATMVAHSFNLASAEGGAQEGDLVAVTAGVPAGVAGRTNLLRIWVVGEEYAESGEMEGTWQVARAEEAGR